jgi:hypothetical protein
VVALVAPGFYRRLPGADLKTADALNDLDERYWKASVRHLRTSDTPRFRAELTEIRAKAEAQG